MLNKLIDRIAKLIDIKSFVTLMLVGVVSVLVLRGQAIEEKFYNLVLMVITYFFAKGTSNGGGNNG